MSPRDENEIIFTVTNDILERYDEPPMSWPDIQEALDQGVEIANDPDPWRIVQPLMSPSDYKWLQRYLGEAEVHEAREVYEAHCAAYGAPAVGSALWTCLDITISSAEYWHERSLVKARKGDIGPQRAWWKRLIKAVAVCASDGVAGTLAASGGGVVGGVVVGYLASYAVDDIIEGGND